MFTGIITDIGTIADVEQNASGRRFTITTELDVESIVLGASIACAGVCLTVIEKTSDKFSVDVSEETLSCTTLEYWESGTKVNLEQALKLGDELGGHWVTGHVDGVAEIMEVLPDGENKRIIISGPEKVQTMIAEKGSVTLDGVALTVNDVQNNIFWVNIIPHTAQHTTFIDPKPYDKLNLEIDPLARYIHRFLQDRG